MLPLLFSLILCFQWAAGDDTVQLSRYHDSPATLHVLPQLLAGPKFVLRGNGDGCPNGWFVCPNFPDDCAPDGSFCCSDGAGNCPNGSICCNDSIGGCCPDGSFCTPGSDTCTGGGGSSGSGGGSSGSGGDSGGGASPSPSFSPSPSLPPSTVHTFNPGGLSVTPTVIITVPMATPSSLGSATPTSSSVLGGLTSGSPHSILEASIAKTAGLAAVIGIFAFGCVF